jgi:hypothetical protein
VAKLFDRYAELVVGTSQFKLPGLAFSFSVEKNADPSPNKASVKIRNLAPNSRLLLSSLSKVPVKLDVGYQQTHGVIFEGNLRSVETTRDGADIITEIRSGDGEDAYREARVNLAIPKGAKVDTVAKQLIAAMGLGLGNVPDAFKNLSLINSRNHPPGVLNGNAAREFTALCRSVGASWSIQNKAVQVLPKGKALPLPAIKLTKDSGLVGAPSISSDGTVKAKSLLNPAITPGQIVAIGAEFIQGQFVVRKASYSGDTHGTEWYVELEGKRY